jgi:AbrB family looped-hinge helix DNA binding protein
MSEVKKPASRPRRRGRTRISAKHQVTIPVEVLRRAGLKPGDELHVETDGAGRVTLVREDDVIAKYAGTFRYPRGYLEKLRSEWR